MCLESLIPMAKHLSKEENQIHTLGTLLAAGEDKSWKVRLAFAKNFAAFADSFGKEITDNNLRTIAENTTPATPKATSSRKR